MRSAFLLTFATLVACTPSSGPSGDPNTDTTETTTTTTTETVPTVPLGTDLGSLMLVRTEQKQGVTVELMGLFVNTHPGFYNLAQCAITGGICFDLLPTVEDDAVPVNTDRVFDPLFSDYRYVGTSVSLGEHEAWFVNGEIPHYYQDLTETVDADDFAGSQGVRLGGEWGDYQGEDDILVSDHLNVMSHDATSFESIHDGETLLIEWEPNGTGDVFFTIEAGFTLTEMYLLEDDGYFELPIDDLALGTETVSLHMNLSRWNWGQVNHDGNEVTVVAVSQLAWEGEYFYVGGRDVLTPANTCPEANAMASVTSGSYWGRLADWGYTDDLDPSYGGCTGYSTQGEDGFLKFDLPPKTIVTITHDLQADDSAAYIVTDCSDEDTCVDGSDVSPGQGPETVSYFNASDQDQVVFGVLDGWRSSNGVYYADIVVDTMETPEMYDTCTDATLQATPLPAGTYYSDATAYTNQLDPGAGGCTATINAGTESMTKVSLADGETFNAQVNMGGANPALYLLYNCTSTNSCAAGSDIDLGTTEALNYTNTSGSTETLYFVVDTKASMMPYFMTVDIN